MWSGRLWLDITEGSAWLGDIEGFVIEGNPADQLFKRGEVCLLDLDLEGTTSKFTEELTDLMGVCTVRITNHTGVEQDDTGVTSDEYLELRP